MSVREVNISRILWLRFRRDSTLDMLQTEGRQTGAVVKKAFAALNAGGQIVVHGIMPDADRIGPVQQTVFSVFMMLSSPRGKRIQAKKSSTGCTKPAL